MTIATVSPQQYRLDEQTGGRPLKILHVFDHSVPLLSGYSIRSFAILREQRRRGWSTAHLTTPKHLGAKCLVETEGEFVFYRSAPMPRRTSSVPYLRELEMIRHVARDIERVAVMEKPDILHAHSPALNGAAALLAGGRLCLPVAYEVRAFWEDAAVDNGTARQGGIRYRLTRALESRVLRRCDAVATICQGLREDILRRGIGTDKVSIIPNGVDVENFPYPNHPNTDLRTALGLEGKTVFGFLGSFYAYEGLDLLLSALPEVLRQEPNTALLLVGGGPVENALKEHAKNLALLEHVRFTGRVPHNRIREYYQAVDVFVYPRHRMRLTDTVTPLKPLEAMALGGVVLASDVGGHRELVRDQETGRLFTADDVNALASAMLGLLRDRDRWPLFRTAARHFVERERTWAAATAGYLAVYERALEKRPDLKAELLARKAAA